MTTTLEEPEIIPATKSKHGFLATPVSENIAVREEDGTLIIVGVPIARTGFQSYAVRDLPQQRAAQLGVDVSDPSATIDLYRPAEEVFAPEFLASLNGVPITDGHPPGGVFVNKDNYSKYALGHIQNPRKGAEPLEDGEWPIVADLVIGGEPLVSRVRNKTVREISLGYDFSIDRDGDRIIQCSMCANHNAIVPDGRAGDQVRIEDAAPEPAESPPAPSSSESIALPEPTKAAYPSIVIFPRNKETKIVSKVNEATPMKKLLRRLLGKEIIEMARATDADPEAVMEAAEALHESPPVEAEDKGGKDDAEPPKNTGANEFQSEDRKRMHDALDKMLDTDDAKGGDRKKAKDADIEELKSLFDDFLSEEEAEPEHADDAPEADPTELDSVLAPVGTEDCPDCGQAMDDCECPGQELAESGEENLVGDEEGESPDPDSDDDEEDVEDKGRAKDAGKNKSRANDARDGARAVLRMLHPLAARTTDMAVRKAFNKALDSVTKSSRVVRAGTGTGYGKFAGAARARDKAPQRARAADSQESVTKLQEFYDNARKGGK